MHFFCNSYFYENPSVALRASAPLSGEPMTASIGDFVRIQIASPERGGGPPTKSVVEGFLKKIPENRNSLLHFEKYNAIIGVLSGIEC